MAVAPHPYPDRLGTDLGEVIRHGLRAVFQPIVDLETSEVVGFEALARGPAGSPLERPDRLFAAGRAQGVVGELDSACRRVALETAIEAGLRAPLSLFLNVEPDGLQVDWDGALFDRPSGAADGLPHVILEITERELTRHPERLMRHVARAHERGWGVAIDDVGVDQRSLGLMPFLRPDVIKLDLALIRDRPAPALARIVHAVRAESERSGALVLAEGIETEAHVERALALGARLGQGYFFGAPGELAEVMAARLTRRTIGRSPRADPVPTPFAFLRDRCRVVSSRKALLIEMSKQLEAEAADIGEFAAVLSAFQHAEFFTPDTKVRYTRLASTTSFVAAMGTEMARQPAPGVHGVAIAADDPLVGEWTVAVVAPHYAACLAAIDLGDTGPDFERRFDYVLTFERSNVVVAAESMMARIGGGARTSVGRLEQHSR